jgi:shikimate dehydrogenase
MTQRTTSPTPIKLAVLGDPISHSRSPWIHRAFGAQHNHQDPGLVIDYRAIQCPLAQLPDTLAAFRAEGGHGLNLTLPLKQAALAHCAALSAAAEASAAVNTLVWREALNGWYGDNTDGRGLLNDLHRLGVRLGGQRILIIGAGGATAGVLPALLAAQPAEVWLINRSPERAQQLCHRHAALGVPLHAAGLDLTDNPVYSAGPFDVLIQATSAGHSGQAPALSAQWLGDQTVVYDLNYGPAHDGVAKWCQDQSRVAYDGLGMLIEQAALSFELWTGWRPDTAPVQTALRQRLNSPM